MRQRGGDDADDAAAPLHGGGQIDTVNQLFYTTCVVLSFRMAGDRSPILITLAK